MLLIASNCEATVGHLIMRTFRKGSSDTHLLGIIHFTHQKGNISKAPLEGGSRHPPEEIPPAPRPPMLLPEPRQAGIHRFWSQTPTFHIPEEAPGGDTSGRVL